MGSHHSPCSFDIFIPERFCDCQRMGKCREGAFHSGPVLLMRSGSLVIIMWVPMIENPTHQFTKFLFLLWVLEHPDGSGPRVFIPGFEKFSELYLEVFSAHWVSVFTYVVSLSLTRLGGLNPFCSWRNWVLDNCYLPKVTHSLNTEIGIQPSGFVFQNLYSFLCTALVWSCCFVYSLIFFKVFGFVWFGFLERESAHKLGWKGAEGEGERENLKQAPHSAQSSVLQPWDQDLSRKQESDA